MMCSRHRPLNGADSVIYLGPTIPPDPRLSMVKCMDRL
jgi:hypothetical protein